MPTLWASGHHGTWDYLAIDLLGSSLDSLHRQKTTDVWDLRSVCCIAQQVVSTPLPHIASPLLLSRAPAGVDFATLFRSGYAKEGC